MTSEQFAYWLQGYSEIAGNAPTAEQWKVVQDHLQTVFTKVTPGRPLMDGYAFDPNGAGAVIPLAASPSQAQTLC